ncbi:YqgQ family protein [Staphylococcus lugdunensis]|jgi:uncharacterized protein YqgQ|uniref:DUF910 family protein n=1 Tax=Staphylococcus lugdunensis TaxID=28035 RepID=A0A133Q276_STALU|nr:MULTISPECIES: YqgQ family protein [Staphylococcus]ADC87458.1 hypothetical protein SLGD_01367 [Staphylococcus lugdunensis HKU09-01]AMG60595.1 hypothetical protein AL499_01190 [Staphylococcus lugdunensis]AMG63217.1 DUF910 domain-containing protein [Staphylococcus lugdunensis]ARJ09225.1 hypothetical protein B7454_07490 [Staphylococcus lugdunensis]ARJ11411.1 hypothetical protein B7466_06390 [Staphylococcus lugdunensis]
MKTKINSFYDVQQLLKEFGYIIYFKNPKDTCEMMAQEIRSLFDYQLISKDTYLKSLLIINQRRNEHK